MLYSELSVLMGLYLNLQFFAVNLSSIVGKAISAVKFINVRVNCYHKSYYH